MMELLFSVLINRCPIGQKVFLHSTPPAIISQRASFGKSCTWHRPPKPNIKKQQHQSETQTREFSPPSTALEHHCRSIHPTRSHPSTHNFPQPSPSRATDPERRGTLFVSCEHRHHHYFFPFLYIVSFAEEE